MSSAGVAPLLATVAAAVSEAIERVRPELAGANLVVRRSDRADFQSNAALPLAKKYGLKPGDLAGELAEQPTADGSTAQVAMAVPSGPGFLNITLTDSAV